MAQAQTKEPVDEVAQLKAELEKAIAALKEVSAKNNELSQENKELRGESDGWLVTTPSPAYDGVTLGVQFHDGAAFIRYKGDYAQARVKPMKDSTLKQTTADEAERKAIREREKTPTAQRLVEQLVHDFGYNAEWFTEADARKLQEKLSNRAALRLQAEEEMKARGESMTRALVKPQTV